MVVFWGVRIKLFLGIVYIVLGGMKGARYRLGAIKFDKIFLNTPAFDIPLKCQIVMSTILFYNI